MKFQIRYETSTKNIRSILIPMNYHKCIQDLFMAFEFGLDYICSDYRTNIERQGYPIGNQSRVSQGRISGWFTVRNNVWAGSVKSTSSSTRSLARHVLELLLFLWNYFIPNSPSNPSIIKRSRERIPNCSSYSFLSLNPIMCMLDISGWIQSFFVEVIIFREFPKITNDLNRSFRLSFWNCNARIFPNCKNLNFGKPWGPPHE